MKTVGIYLSEVIERLGLDPADTQFKDIVGITTSIPADVLPKFESVMTEEQAKQNPTIKQHYLKNFIQGANIELDKKLEDMGVSKEDRDELFKNKLYTDRVVKAFDMVKDLGSGKGGDEIEGFKTQISKLNADLVALRTTHETEKNEIASKYESQIMEGEITRAFSSKNWSSAYSEDIRNDLAKIAIQKKKAAEGFEIVRDSNSGELKLVNKDNPEMDYFDKSNKKITFNQLVDTIMSESKFSAVAPPAQSAQQVQVAAGSPPAQSANPTSSKVKDLLHRSMSDQAKNL